MSTASTAVDGHTFIVPEVFFSSSNISSFEYPTHAIFVAEDNNAEVNPAVKTGAIFRLSSFNGGDPKFLLLQFIRPTVWRIRFDPTKQAPHSYTDYNNRAVILDTLASLRAHLDEVEGIWWRTRVDYVKQQSGSQRMSYFSLKSIVYSSEEERRINSIGITALELRVYEHPFRIEAIRNVTESTWNVPAGTLPHTAPKIIWSTPERPVGYKTVGTTHNVVLTTNKPGSARYFGFGTQGGQDLLKPHTLMNYFNFDNMTYSSVYGLGPKDEREPLYHSEPYWIELNGVPGYESQVSTFIDNHSQVMVDFLATNSGRIRAATRFGELHYFVTAGNNIGQLISSLTSILGRSRLKPRYTLGHHQSCYGYDNRAKVLTIGHEYVKRDIPLDAMHIDVDIQDDYRTFTIDVKGRFPEPQTMFAELRELGIVCSTNITPVITNRPDKTYTTLNEGLAKGYFLPDIRYDEYNKGPVPARQVEYIAYEHGVKLRIDPINEKPGFRDDDYDFETNYNSGKPYRGGVGYGGTLGAPGLYLDLNRKEVREFWGRQYAYLFLQGLEFVWQDMTTPSIAKEFGDVKGLPFRLMVTDDQWEIGEEKQGKRPAIEIWALYSYNLHKATYEGLNNLPSRINKRNFIIGRGSFAGQHRYAGLWTGDNASTWDHFQISVCQVLAIGLGGQEISGADVGGFMPQWIDGKGNKPYADPELLVRWYCAYALLPWFRNHYHGKRGMKLFQEPWAFTDYFLANPRAFPESERYLWLAVEPVCRYYVKLRYTLLQLLYDAMFEHQFTGLPIARALVITDMQDTTLLGENDWCLDNQYIVRKDLLVCPVMQPAKVGGGGREIYLPQPNWWYPFNLGITPDGFLPGRRLGPRIRGGDRFFVDAHISGDEGCLPYALPMYVREGGIIPQISARQSTSKGLKPNPIIVHFYPGQNVENTYIMYLDDGVSRSSAPDFTKKTAVIAKNPSANVDSDIDPLAASEYREIHFKQICHSGFRLIKITVPHDGYGLENVRADIGYYITLVIWHDLSDVRSTPECTLIRNNIRIPFLEYMSGIKYVKEVGATRVLIPVDEPEVECGELRLTVIY